MKHFFEAIDYGDKIIIHSTERPDDDEEFEDVEDANDLVHKSNVKIGFDPTRDTPHGDNGN